MATMELKFQIPTKAYYLEKSDEYEYDYEEVYFEPADDELNQCVATCIFEDYFEQGMFDKKEREEIIAHIKDFISDKNLTDKFAKDDYSLQVHEWFEKEAIKNYG